MNKAHTVQDMVSDLIDSTPVEQLSEGFVVTGPRYNGVDHGVMRLQCNDLICQIYFLIKGLRRGCEQYEIILAKNPELQPTLVEAVLGSKKYDPDHIHIEALDDNSLNGYTWSLHDRQAFIICNLVITTAIVIQIQEMRLQSKNIAYYACLFNKSSTRELESITGLTLREMIRLINLWEPVSK